MTANQLTTDSVETAIARPLSVLVPLIQKDLERAQEAGMDYYRAAGEKLIEAKSSPGMKHGDFTSWVKRNFVISMDTAQRYMKYAEAVQKPHARGFSSLNEFHRVTGDPAYRSVTTKRPWHEPVKKIIGKVDTATLNLRKAELDREAERKAERKLALQLIDIGFKTLATKLHPDKGGSRDAMARLNRVRKRLCDHA